MKKKILIVVSLFIPFIMYSQDLIIKSNGERLECNITSVDSVNVNFTLQKYDREIKTFIPKEKIKSYEYDYINREAGDRKLERDSIFNSTNFRLCVTIGILQGGGSIVGVDFEFLLTDYIGIQGGAGYKGFGAGLNIHTKPKTQSSFIALQYWHQGFGETFTQSLLGPCFVFRGKKWFTAQIGLGFALEKGPAWPESKEQPPAMLTYAIGGYIPW